MLFHKKSKQSSTASPDGCGDLRLELLPLLSHGRVSAPLSSLSDRGTPDPPPYPWAGLSSSFPEASEKDYREKEDRGVTQGTHSAVKKVCSTSFDSNSSCTFLEMSLNWIWIWTDMNFIHTKHQEKSAHTVLMHLWRIDSWMRSSLPSSPMNLMLPSILILAMARCSSSSEVRGLSCLS